MPPGTSGGGRPRPAIRMPFPLSESVRFRWQLPLADSPPGGTAARPLADVYASGGPGGSALGDWDLYAMRFQGVEPGLRGCGFGLVHRGSSQCRAAVSRSGTCCARRHRTAACGARSAPVLAASDRAGIRARDAGTMETACESSRRAQGDVNVWMRRRDAHGRSAVSGASTHAAAGRRVRRQWPSPVPPKNAT